MADHWPLTTRAQDQLSSLCPNSKWSEETLIGLSWISYHPWWIIYDGEGSHGFDWEAEAHPYPKVYEL